MNTQGKHQRIVVVGASMAGLRTAEQLRSIGWDKEIVVIGEEEHPPYNRPPLSKEVLSLPNVPEDLLDPVRLRQRSSASTIDFRLGERAVTSDLANRTVTLDSGESVSYDGLVIATGLRPRRLNLSGPQTDRFVVRTIDDAVRLRERLHTGAKVAVLGCGFIGCEVAATALSLGCEVQLVEGSTGPMHQSLGPTVSAAMRDWLVARGLQMHTGTSVEEILTAGDEQAEHIVGLRLADGAVIEAEVLVEAIGSEPNTDWLEGNGLDLSDGVLVDDRLRVIGADAAVAAGDITRFSDRWADGQLRRVEHWQSAIDTAKTAARTLTSELTGADAPQPYSAIPSFWSDVFGIRVQGLGAPHSGTECAVLEGSLDAIESGFAVAYTRGGILVGVVTVGLPPARMIQFREQLGQPVAELQPTALSFS